jgi:hypothetical protein
LPPLSPPYSSFIRRTPERTYRPKALTRHPNTNWTPFPRRRRHLGPAKHEEIYDAAHLAQEQLLDCATPPSPEGAPAVH